MKKNLSSIAALLVLVGLTGCEKYPNEEWRINNEELIEKYYSIYLKTTEDIIKTYIEDSEIEISKVFFFGGDCYELKLTLSDDYHLVISYYLHTHNGRIAIHIEKNSITFEERFNINYTYFEMLNEINKKVVYELYGDENTFPYLLENMKLYSDGDYYSSYYFHEKPRCNYSVQLRKRDLNYFDVWYSFAAELTDKNVWED